MIEDSRGINITIFYNNMILKYQKRFQIIVCLFLVVITIAVYWGVTANGFVMYDDNLYVTDNQVVQNGMTLDGFIWAFTTGTQTARYFHPLTWLSHMMDCMLFGLNPAGHHLINLVIHVANTLLLFYVFFIMTGSLWKCAFLAAVFALHPLNVESVAWVAERKNVLCAFFWLLTLWAYTGYTGKENSLRYFPVLIFFILALMSKPVVVTLPFVFLLLDYWPLGRLKLFSDNQGKKNLKLLVEKIPFFIIITASSITTFIFQKSGGAVASLESFPLKSRLSNIFVSYLAYIKMMILPHNLAVIYPYSTKISIWKSAGSLFLLLLLSIIVLKMWRKHPYLIVGWLWYLGTLVPVIGLVQVGFQSMADRYTYLPFIGLFIMIIWGADELSGHWQLRKIAPVPGVIILLLLMVITWKQVAYWKNSETLFEHAVQVTENNWVAQHNLGVVFFEAGELDKAITHFKKTLEIKPRFVKTLYTLGTVLADQGKTGQAVSLFLKALRIEPENFDSHYQLANVLYDTGKLDEAIYHYQKALEIKPQHSDAHFNLGKLFAEEGKYQLALLNFAHVIRINPDNAQAYYNIGKIFILNGKPKQAKIFFKKAIDLKPDYSEALENLQTLSSPQSGKIKKTDEL